MGMKTAMGTVDCSGLLSGSVKAWSWELLMVRLMVFQTVLQMVLNWVTQKAEYLVQSLDQLTVEHLDQPTVEHLGPLMVGSLDQLTVGHLGPLMVGDIHSHLHRCSVHRDKDRSSC
jgi:hypothetical protein